VVRDDDGQYKASILAISGENEGNGWRSLERI
jgi:hypothetical protein